MHEKVDWKNRNINAEFNEFVTQVIHIEALKPTQAKQADLAAAVAQTSKLTQELEQRQADNAAAISAAKDRCRDLQAAVNQVSSRFFYSL